MVVILPEESATVSIVPSDSLGIDSFEMVESSARLLQHHLGSQLPPEAADRRPQGASDRRRRLVRAGTNVTHSDQHIPRSWDDPSQLTERLSALHLRIRSIFDELELTTESVSRRRLAEHLAQQLRAHATLEEEVLFPLVRELGGQAACWVEQAHLVHRSIDGLQHELLATDLSPARLRGFRDMVTRCLEDEETRIFPSVEGLDEASTGELQRRISAYERGSVTAGLGE